MSVKLFEWIRVLRYVGTREELDTAVQKRGVKGSVHWNNCAIYESFVGDTPQPISFSAAHAVVHRLKAEAAKLPVNEYTRGYQQGLQAVQESLPL